MSQIEETLSRISKMGGVEGYVITDGDGNVVRQSKSFSDEVAASYASEVSKLTKRARHLVRDLDPKVRLRLLPTHPLSRLPLLPPAPQLFKHARTAHPRRAPPPRTTSSSFACAPLAAGKFWQRPATTAW